MFCGAVLHINLFGHNKACSSFNALTGACLPKSPKMLGSQVLFLSFAQRILCLFNYTLHYPRETCKDLIWEIKSSDLKFSFSSSSKLIHLFSGDVLWLYLMWLLGWILIPETRLSSAFPKTQPSHPGPPPRGSTSPRVDPSSGTQQHHHFQMSTLEVSVAFKGGFSQMVWSPPAASGITVLLGREQSSNRGPTEETQNDNPNDVKFEAWHVIFPAYLSHCALAPEVA